ncbi:MAG: hypothetical protein ABWW66_03655 [Archaeoglobaceae archaeon]
MREPFSVSILGFGIAWLIFFLVSLAAPGFFIWLAFRLLGRERSFLRCIFANFASFVAAGLILTILHFTPLFAISLLAAFFTYLYVMKELLDVSLTEAFLATVVAVAIVIVVLFVLALVFGFWLVSPMPTPRF